METTLSPYDPPFSGYAQLCKMGPRATKNGATSILRTDSNSATLKTTIIAVSSKSNEFDKLIQKNALIVRAFWKISTFLKLSEKFPILL